MIIRRSIHALRELVLPYPSMTDPEVLHAKLTRMVNDRERLRREDPVECARVETRERAEYMRLPASRRVALEALFARLAGALEVTLP